MEKSSQQYLILNLTTKFTFNPAITYLERYKLVFINQFYCLTCTLSTSNPLFFFKIINIQAGLETRILVHIIGTGNHHSLWTPHPQALQSLGQFSSPNLQLQSKPFKDLKTCVNLWPLTRLLSTASRCFHIAIRKSVGKPSLQHV